MAFTEQDVELIQRDILYQGVFCLARYHIRYRLFDGGMSEIVKREVLERFSATAVLPYDPIRDEVVLIEQFRPGCIRDPKQAWLIEIPAGVLHANQSPETVAISEADEEAGCKVTDLIPVSDFFVSPGGSNEYMHLYCGKVDAKNISGIHGLKHEHEDIRAFTLSAEKAFDLLDKNQIKTVPAMVTLWWLKVHRERLRKKWE